MECRRFNIRGICLTVVLLGLIPTLPLVAEEKPAPPPPGEGVEKSGSTERNGAKAAEKLPNKRPPRPQIGPRGPIRFNIQVPGGRQPILPGGPAPGSSEGLEETVLFARDRDAEQLLKKATTFLEEKRYSEAARALGAIIEAPEDFFFQPGSSEPQNKSLRGEAKRLLGGMSDEGRQAYELQFGPRAAELLKEALQERDWNKLAEVSRRFFHTEAGYRATYLLALYHLDQQRPLAGALGLERLHAAGKAARQLEPALSLQLANAWLRAGVAEKARQSLVRLKSQFGNEPISIEGKPINWFREDGQAVAWLGEHIGSQQPQPMPGQQEWTMHRGDPTRNAATVGSTPLLDSEGDCWSIPNVDDAGINKLIQSLRQTYQDANFSALPAFFPLAVDNIVLMRTISTLLAVDFKTGKRLWNIPVDENWGEVTDLHGAISQQGNSSQVISLLDQRLWDDATYGCLSSDGRYVFSVEDLNFTLPGAAQQPRMIVLPNGRRLPAPAWPRNFNRLTAHDIHTGKLKWELGGPRGEFELPMAGAFFLGPPLPLLGVVYAVAEVNGEIRLTAIDATTGAVQWGQQLAVVELDVLQDPSRRFSGVSPSCADGVLVCPTGSGAVVAIELATRSLLWGYRFQNTAALQPTMIGRRIGAMIMFTGRPREETDRWLDSSATIAGQRVIVTPIESNEIHCISLLEGKLLWKKPRGDNLYVAGIHGENVILVARGGVTALKLDDGQPAWESQLEFSSGGTPSGRGFLSGDRYYLPLSTADVVAIDLNQGKIVQQSHSRKQRVPGNLLCYRGMIISQSPEAVETFFELDTLKAQVAKAIEANPGDPRALAQRGALALHDGNTEAAIEDLRKAFDLAPKDRTRDLLVDALFEGLTTDFAHYAALGKKLEELISTPEEKSQFIRLMAQGLHRQGKHRAAFELYVQLADLSAAPLTVDRLEDSRRARRDRWAQAGLTSLYAELSSDERAGVDAKIESLANEATKAASPDSLRRFVQFFGFHPSAQAVRDQLATRLASAGEWLAAELLWRQVAAVNDDLGRQAKLRLALAMKTAGRVESARFYADRLRGELAEVVLQDNKTGRQWADAVESDPAVKRYEQGEAAWPKGRIIKERDERQNPASRYFAAEFAGQAGIYPGVMTIEMSQDRQTIVGRDGNGIERWKASLGDPALRHNVNPSVLQARAVGNLVVVSLGSQIVAIDTLAAGPAGMTRILWTQEVGDAVPGLANQVGVHVRQIDLAWGQRRNQVSDGFGRPVGLLGQLSESYCCLQRGRELIAVDPLNGEVLWARGEIEPASEIFGDEEILFVVPPNGTEAMVINARDGKELGRRQVPLFIHRVAALGRRVVAWQSEAGKSVFAMNDIWDQKQIWRHEFPAGSMAYQTDQQILGVVDPKGRFVAIDLEDGHVAIDCAIEPETGLHDIYLLVSAERLLLFTNRPWANNQDGVSIQAVPGVLNNPLLNGMAYGFDRMTGKQLWKTRIDKQGLTLDQPRDLPVLVFASRIYERQVGQGGVNTEPYTAVSCLDKRTGEFAYQERIKGHIGMFEIVAEPEEHSILLKLLRHSVRMKFTAEPNEAEAKDADAKQAAGEREVPSSFNGAAPKQAPEAGPASAPKQAEKVEPPAPGPEEQSSLRGADRAIRLELVARRMPAILGERVA